MPENLVTIQISRPKTIIYFGFNPTQKHNLKSIYQ